MGLQVVDLKAVLVVSQDAYGFNTSVLPEY